MPYLLGIDVGTSATIALLTDDRGEVVATASAPHTLLQPHPGWSEQEPEQWYSAAVAAVRELLNTAHVPGDLVAAIGLSGQMHGSVFLDKAAATSGGSIGTVIRPALLWNDQRTAAQCAAIESAIGGRAELVKRVGNAALTGFTAPKILWLRDNEPENYAKLVAVCLPKDYLAFRLTGNLATDVGDASGTLLFDVSTRDWHREVCNALAINPAILPRPHESFRGVGLLTHLAARDTGLRADTPVIIGSGDNMTSAVGSGIVEPGIVAAALGTSGVIVAHADAPAFDLSADQTGRTHTMCSASGAWCITGCMLSAGGSLKWVRDTLFPGVSYNELMFEAAKVPAGAGGLLFLPHLTGERCPHPDPSARGAWVGLTSRHTRGHLVRSVVEGVSFTLAQILDIVRAMNIPAEKVRISGGGARSPFWRQLLADVFNCPVALTNSEEGPAHGAAILAGVGIGIWPSVPHACREVIRETSSLSPQPAGQAQYAEARQAFESLYPTLKPHLHALTAIDR